MTGLPGTRVIIIGGGASGVLMACHLLRDQPDDCVVTLIERREKVGPGLAFSTDRPEHLLNVRAANMSAFPDDPLHFWRWLSAGSVDRFEPCPDPYCFAPRHLYGDYVSHLVERAIPGSEGQKRLHIVRGECCAIEERPNGIAVTLADGTTHLGQVAVLATGNEAYDWQQAGRYLSPWGAEATALAHSPLPILILGTGLSMVDYVLTLLQKGYSRPIYALSRRGLLPRVHQDAPVLRPGKEDVPFGGSAMALLRWFRQALAEHARQGGDWRSVVDGIRPFSQEIWWKLSVRAKGRLLEHARAHWDVHRHRMAPQAAKRLEEATASGQLKILSGKIALHEAGEHGLEVSYRPRSRPTLETLQVGSIVDCRGITADPGQSANPVLKSLLAQGLARVDALRIGVDVSAECALLNTSGLASRRLFAIGPLTRAAFWETVAIPDIREQCTKLARHIKLQAAR
ncbi:FAD/NAD(P)-binding protein [Bosea sp. NPDC055332]